MGCEWPIRQLKDVSDEVTVGYVGTMADQYMDQGVLFLRSLNIRPFGLDLSDVKFVAYDFHKKIRKSALHPGDVVIVRTGRPGTCAVIPEGLGQLNCSDLVIVRCSPELRPHFACYWINAMASDHVHAYSVGAVQQHFNVSSAKVIPIPVPSLLAQDQVLSVLRSLDCRIDLLRQTNTTLEAIAQALFKSWFVDFDPVHAKAEGREPEAMDAATAALFPSEFEESELGLIPKGWRTTTLRDAFEINPRRPLRKGVTVPYLDMASVPTSGHVPTPPTDREFSSGTKFQNGDTLLARITPCLENGKTAHVDFLDDGQIGWGSTEFIVLRPKTPLTPYFGYLLTRQSEFRAFAIQAMTGTSGRQRVELGQLEQFLLTIPDEAVAAAFGSFVEPIRKTISANADRAATLAALRNALLPRLVSGKLRLPGAAPTKCEAIEA